MAISASLSLSGPSTMVDFGGQTSPFRGWRGRAWQHPPALEDTLRRRSLGVLARSPASGSRLSASTPLLVGGAGGGATSSSLRQSTQAPPQILSSTWRRSPTARSSPDMAGRMKDKSWIRIDDQSSSWASQARSLAKNRLSGPMSLPENKELLLQQRLRLLLTLEQENVPQGLQALSMALRLKCGSLEAALACLECGRRPGDGVPLLEFAGSLVLLGIDAPELCGFDEIETAKLLGLGSGDKDCIRVRGLLSCADASRRRKGQNVTCEDIELARRWILIAKFVALSAWAYTPRELRKRPGTRNTIASSPNAGGGVRDRADSMRVLSEHSAQVADTTPASASHESDIGILRASMGSSILSDISVVGARDTCTLSAEDELQKLRQDVLRTGELVWTRPFSQVAESMPKAIAAPPSDVVRGNWAPAEETFELMEHSMREVFAAYAKKRQFGITLMDRSSFFALLGPKTLGALFASSEDEQAVVNPTRGELGEIYDDVYRWQSTHTSSTEPEVTKGLTFESLRLALLRVALAAGSALDGLVVDAITAIDPRFA